MADIPARRASPVPASARTSKNGSLPIEDRLANVESAVQALQNDMCDLKSDVSDLKSGVKNLKKDTEQILDLMTGQRP